MAQKIKRHFLKRFITSITLLCLGLPSILLLTSQLAVAGVPTGTMTGSAQILTVGVSPVAMNAITVTDDALSAQITSGNDIRIRIPAAVNATWDPADATATLTQPAVTGVVSPAVSFADSNKTLILDVTTGFATGESVVISGLYYIPTAASTATVLDWAVDGAVPTYLAGDTTTGITVTAADAAATLTKASAISGSTGDLTLVINTGRILAVGEKINIDFPASYAVAATTGIVAGSITLNGTNATMSASVALQTLTLTVADFATAQPALTITIPGLDAIPQYVDATDATITVTTALGATIATDTTVALDDTVAAVSVATVDFGTNITVGTAGDTTINLTVPFALDADDTIDITFPLSVDISGITLDQGATGTFESAANITCNASGQTLTCVTNGATVTSGTIILANILTKYVDATNITVFEVENEGSATQDIAIDTDVAMEDPTPATDLASSIALGLNSEVGTDGNTTLTLTPPRALAAADTIVFTMPTNFTAGSAAFGSTTFLQTGGIAATFTSCGGVGRIVTCTASSSIQVGVAGNIVITGIQSLWDSAAATTVTDLTINDVAAGGADIALDTTTTVPDTTPETELNSSITLGTNSVVGTAGNTTLTLTPPRALAATDTMVWTMPTNFSVPEGAITIASQTLSSGTFPCTGVAATRVITCTVTGGTVTADVERNIVMSGILSLWVSGATNVANLTINDIAGGSGGLDIALDTITVVDATTVGVLSSTNVEPDSLAVGSSSINTITFTTVTSFPNLGKIVVTYPSGFGVSGANGVVATNLSGLDGVWTATVSGQVVTLTQVGGTLSAAGVKSLRIANIVTPGVAGSTGTYTITTTTSADVNIETNAAVTADTVVVNQSNNNGGGGGGGGGGSVDTTPPTNTSVAIVGAPKVPTATVQLTLAATGATQMMISNVADFTGATWETYNTVKDWTLTSGLGAKIVYVKFRDAASNVSTAVQSNVTVDVTAPTPVPVVEPPIVGVPFLDIATHWAKDYIVKLFIKGVVQGRTATSYVPDGLLTRAEMVKIALLTFGFKIDDTKKQSFIDVSATHWAASYLALAKTEGIVGGYTDGTFHPDTSITRVEALKILLAAAKKNIVGAAAASFVDVDQEAWYANYVNYAFANKVVSGKDATHFDPSANITRAEMAKIAILTSEL
ncbi:MAG: S-layer homology domain-containing protein [Candidatus Gracilibacteria bacterium]|jgi:hypothetical protein